MCLSRSLYLIFAIIVALQMAVFSQPLADAETYAEQPSSNIARIGNDIFTPNYAKGLEQLPSLYPVNMLAPVPIERPVKINLIETELLYRDAVACYPKAVDSIKTSRELDWKKRAVATMHYYQNGLRSYFGYPWPRLEEHYKKNQAHFDSMVTNAGNGLSATSAHNVALELFLKECPPDTALMRKELIAAGQTRIAIPTNPTELNNLWGTYISVKAANDFFLAKFFKEKFKKNLPEKLVALVDKAEYGIQAADTAMIANWVAQKSLAGLNPNSPAISTEEKIRTLLRWKLFSEKARTFSSDVMTEELAILDNLCLKYEIALWHCRNHIVAPIIAGVSVDTAVARLAFTVYNATHEKKKAQAGVNEFQEYAKLQVIPHQTSLIVEKINELYKKYNVVLLDPELRQSWWVAPTTLLKTADSLARIKQDSLSILYRQYYLRDYSFLPQFNEVLLRVADQQMALASKDTAKTFQAIGTLYHGLIAAKDPAAMCACASRLLAIFKGQTKYAEAEKACQHFMVVRGEACKAKAKK